MSAVKLLKPWKHYNEGEIAGFGEEINQKLIKAGIAEAYVEAGIDEEKVERKARSGKRSADGDTPPAAPADTADGAGSTEPEGQ